MMMMILLFVACSTPWVKPVLAHVQPDDAWLLQLSPEPQQGSGHGAPMSSIAGIEADYAKIEEEILACFAPLLKHKWCIDELQGSISTNGKIQVSDACQKMVDSITREMLV